MRDEKNQLIQALQTAHQELSKMNIRISIQSYMELRKANPSVDLPTVEVYQKRFDSWLNALDEANLT